MFVLLLMSLMGMDTPVVSNGLTPKGKAQVLVLEQDLRLSPEDGDDYLWPALDTNVVVNSKGQMLVADQKENRIMVYNPDGSLNKVIGSEGDGPGQFKGLRFVHVLEDDRIVAFDFRQAVSHFNLFDRDGTYQSHTVHQGMSKLLVNVDVAPNNDYFFSVYLSINQTNGNMDLQTGLLKRGDLSEIKKLSSLIQPAFDPQRANEPKYWSERLGDEIKAMASNRGVVAFDGNSNIYTAMSGAYEITIYTPDLKKRMIVKKEYKPVPFTEAETSALLELLKERVVDQLPPHIQSIISDSVIKKALDHADLSPAMNPVHGIIPMTDGKFLVVSKLSFANASGRADIFSKEGKFLGSFEHGNNGLVNIYNSYLTRMIFRGKHAYTIETDDEGENYLTRYSYKLKAK